MKDWCWTSSTGNSPQPERAPMSIADRNGEPYYERVEKAPEQDDVNHPAHYADRPRETMETIEDSGYSEGFCLGSAIKYITRAGDKQLPGKTNVQSYITDLEKAVWFLLRRIDYVKRHNGT